MFSLSSAHFILLLEERAVETHLFASTSLDWNQYSSLAFVIIILLPLLYKAHQVRRDSIISFYQTTITFITKPFPYFLEILNLLWQNNNQENNALTLGSFHSTIRIYIPFGAKNSNGQNEVSYTFSLGFLRELLIHNVKQAEHLKLSKHTNWERVWEST